MPNNLSQDAVKDKIRNYLTQMGDRDEDFINQFEKGYCRGISSLWFYGKWLEDQPETGKPRDDNSWFISTRDMIADWDGNISFFTPEDPKNPGDPARKRKEDIERFISHIQFFQHTNKYVSANLGNLDKEIAGTKPRKVLEDTQNRDLKKEYSIASLFTLDQLKQLLETENLIQPNKMILILSHNHATALFNRYGVYYYFDPNDQEGELATGSLDEVAEAIFAANFYVKNPDDDSEELTLDPTRPSPLIFKAFSFDAEPQTKYPDQQELLAKINPSLDYQSIFYPGHTGLIKAAEAGCLESAQYFLAEELKKEIPNLDICNEDGQTALILANNTDIALMLLKNGANHNIKDNNDQTPLIAHSARGLIQVVEKLLEKNADHEARDKFGWTALMYAAKFGHVDVIKKLLAVNADPNIQFTSGGVLSKLNNATARMIAEENGQVETANILRMKEEELSAQVRETRPLQI